MKYFFLVIFLLLVVFLETYYFSVPLTMSAVIVAAILFPRWWIFLVTVLLGILLDSLTFQRIGGSSLVFSICLGLVYLYSRKYEVQNPFFVGVSVFLSSLLYAAIFIQKYSFWGALVCSVLMTGIYIGIVLIRPVVRNNLLAS